LNRFSGCCYARWRVVTGVREVLGGWSGDVGATVAAAGAVWERGLDRDSALFLAHFERCARGDGCSLAARGRRL